MRLTYHILAAMAFLAVFLFSEAALAQGSGIALKIYTNASLRIAEKDLGYDPFTNLNSTEKITALRTGFFTPAIHLTRPNGNFQEIEVSALRIGITDHQLSTYDSLEHMPIRGSKDLDILIAVRYEYNFSLSNTNDARMKPYIGISLDTYYGHESEKPHTSASFPRSVHSLGMDIAVTPRLIYSVSERIFIDLNIPVTVAGFSYSNHNIQNPTLPQQNRDTHSMEYELLPAQYLLRIGAGVRI